VGLTSEISVASVVSTSSSACHRSQNRQVIMHQSAFVKSAKVLWCERKQGGGMSAALTVNGNGDPSSLQNEDSEMPPPGDERLPGLVFRISSGIPECSGGRTVSE